MDHIVERPPNHEMRNTHTLPPGRPLSSKLQTIYTLPKTLPASREPYERQDLVPMTRATPSVTQPPRASVQKRFDDANYISLTMEFRCNLRCTHCMIEGTMDRLATTPDTTFETILNEQRERGTWEGLVLTGSEITLRRDLPDLARRARASGFENIRIQTHGMHLARPGYLERLLDAGINEFFISVAGHDAELHDHITKVPGAFGKMMTGIEKIESANHAARIITNTVVTRESYHSLDAIVARLAPYQRVVRHEFWNFFPMHEKDVKGLIVPYRILMPHVIQAIKASVAHGRKVEVKNIPECLLGNLRHHLVNDQPMLMIDPNFWTEFDRNGFYACPHRSQCSSEQCLGLTEAYIDCFGTEDTLLSPLMPQENPL